jgi:gas vesicle protein
MENMNLDSLTIIFSLAIFFSPVILKRFQGVGVMASTVTSLGILGTFLGIFIGLLHFDVNNIQESVPELLGGLKTAFLTSIAGLVSSLLLKSFPRLYGITVKKEDAAREEIGLEAMLAALGRIEKAIAGVGETTLVTQVQKLRTSTTDGLDKLNDSFREFAEKVVADSTQALIDSLTQVMRDFNAQINAQFGDNFKQLNDAVGKMLEWQKEYAARVEAMTGQFAQLLTGVGACAEMVEAIADKTAVYHSTATSLQALLSSLNTSLVGIENVSAGAKNMLPSINSAIEILTTNFAAAVQTSVRENNRMLEAQRAVVDRQVSAMGTLQERYGSVVNQLSQHIDKLMKDNAARIGEQLIALDKGLQNELNKALSSLGTQLTSLSAKFVEDYQPLTEKLRQIVQITKPIPVP